jgi:hypothetical protein
MQATNSNQSRTIGHRIGPLVSRSASMVVIRTCYCTSEYKSLILSARRLGNVLSQKTTNNFGLQRRHRVSNVLKDFAIHYMVNRSERRRQPRASEEDVNLQRTIRGRRSASTSKLCRSFAAQQSGSKQRHEQDRPEALTGTRRICWQKANSPQGLRCRS